MLNMVEPNGTLTVLKYLISADSIRYMPPALIVQEFFPSTKAYGTVMLQNFNFVIFLV
jgi:hypothetical protein